MILLLSERGPSETSRMRMRELDEVCRPNVSRRQAIYHCVAWLASRFPAPEQEELIRQFHDQNMPVAAISSADRHWADQRRRLGQAITSPLVQPRIGFNETDWLGEVGGLKPAHKPFVDNEGLYGPWALFTSYLTISFSAFKGNARTTVRFGLAWIVMGSPVAGCGRDVPWWRASRPS